MKLFQEEKQNYNNLLDRVVVDITLNKMGGFIIGEGEYFCEDLSQSDYLIRCTKDGETYTTVFAPNPLKIKENQNLYNEESKEHFKELYDSFRNIITYRISKEGIIQQLKELNDSSCIYRLDTSLDIITIDDMCFFYLDFIGAEIKRELL